MMAEHDDLVARLRALGERPVDPVVASEHLTAMANLTGAGRRGARSRFGRTKLVAAFAAGLVLGGTSLASAGVMGQGAQNAVADVAAKVNVNLPGGTERSTDGCGGITARNHGDFVRQGGDPKANCGKPRKAVENKAKAGSGDGSGNEGAGCKPPWAGKGLTKDQRKALKTPEAVAAQQACDPAGAEAESDGDDPGNQGKGDEHRNNPATTGTVSSQGADVTPPSGGADANAGVPGGGSTPPADDPADGIRPSEPGEPATPPSITPQGGGPAGATTTTTTTTTAPTTTTTAG